MSFSEHCPDQPQPLIPDRFAPYPNYPPIKPVFAARKASDSTTPQVPTPTSPQTNSPFLSHPLSLSISEEKRIDLDVSSFNVSVSRINLREMAASPTVPVTMTSFFDKVEAMVSRAKWTRATELKAVIQRKRGGEMLPGKLVMEIADVDPDAWAGLRAALGQGGDGGDQNGGKKGRGEL